VGARNERPVAQIVVMGIKPAMRRSVGNTIRLGLLKEVGRNGVVTARSQSLHGGMLLVITTITTIIAGSATTGTVTESAG